MKLISVIPTDVIFLSTRTGLGNVFMLILLLFFLESNVVELARTKTSKLQSN